MKRLLACLLICVSASLALAQTERHAQSTPPDLEILFSYVGQRTASYVTTEQLDQTTVRTAAFRAELSNDPFRRQSLFVKKREQQVTDYALLRLRNTSTKPIKAIAWEVPYLHVKNQQGMTRYTFHSKLNLAPGETVKLEKRMPRSSKQLRLTAVSGPAGSYQHGEGGGLFVSLNTNSNEAPFDTHTYTAQNGLVFQVPADWRSVGISVTRIEYADGSVWQR